jgi:hypothetical protein
MDNQRSSVTRPRLALLGVALLALLAAAFVLGRWTADDDDTSAVTAPGTSGRPLGFAAGDDLLASLPPLPPADDAKPPPSRPCPTEDPCLRVPARNYRQFLTWVIRDVNDVWSRGFVGAGFGWSSPTFYLIGRDQFAEQPCRGPKRVTADDPRGAFYCPVRYEIFFPLLAMKADIFPKRSWRKTDFASAWLVAHEMGHHFQTVWAREDAEFAKIFKRMRSIHDELMADCLAGVWAYTTWSRKLIEDGDIDEAVRLQRQYRDPPGTPMTDPGAHGNARQRVRWFKRGWNSGETENCATYTASGLPKLTGQ